MTDTGRADIERLKRFLKPRHIAVLGGKWSDVVVRKIKQIGFEGEIWPVSPTRDTLGDMACFKSLSDLPEPPDAVFVGVNRHATVDVVGELNRMGAGGAMCFASGFAEVGDEGRELQDRLVEAAGDMPIEGPNCYGMLNYLDGVTLWPDEHGGHRVDEGVAILCQSGNIAINMTMQQRSLPIAYMITMGNQATMGVSEFIEAMLDDPRIKAIGILIEGINDIPAFSRVAIRALEKGIPIVAIKSGRTEAGAAITVSHTSTLSGSDDNYQALFEHLGIYRCYSLPGFLEALKFLSYAGTLSGNRVVSLSCSGGEAAMVADSIADMRLDFAQFSEDQRTAIRATLNDLVSISNPFDYHTFIWAIPDAMEATFTEVMRCGYDATMLLMDFPKPGLFDTAQWNVATEAFFAASKATGALGIIVSTLPEGLSEEERAKFISNGIIPMQGLDDCLHAIECAAWIGGRQREVHEGRVPAAIANLKTLIGGGEAVILDEWQSKQALREYGLAVPEGRLVSAEGASEAAVELGFPVVVKAVSSDLTHKTDVGGVALHLHDGAAVAEAVADMAHLSSKFLVERMMSGAIAELIIGVKRDPQFGPVLVVGAGGVFVELLRDSRTLLLPVSRDQAADAIGSLRVASLLRGYRGGPAGDFAAAVDAVLAVAEYADANRDGLRELDVNPLLVFEVGVVAVDALIRTS